MILVFGGTTEGRKAVEVLEESGSPFYYSTKMGEQEVALKNGQAIHGALRRDDMLNFCREHNIRLIVDAAHPFASHLHHTVAEVAGTLGIPAIRFERIFPPRDPELTWIDDYSQIPSTIHSLLATTGVQSISKLQPLEAQGVSVYYRILPRSSSMELAKEQGATPGQLYYYDSPADIPVQTEAILLKESGLSGGFQEKVDAAKARGMTVFVLKRPDLSFFEHQVNGEHGLRRMVEQLLPSFFPLHSGLTTGTCATAAAVAATMMLSQREQGTDGVGKQLPTTVPVVLPDGETISVPVGYGDGYAYCIKQAGDDPDVTDGLEIRATVLHRDNNLSSPSDNDSDIVITGGTGVGRFTLPGFDFPPGEAAINRVPRQMMRQNVRLTFAGCSPLQVIISVPDGEQIAQKTFNPRLGIEGGISIIGVSGIVKPFSEEAFISSIHKCMEVAKASGAERVVINSGAKSERFVKALYPDLPRQAFVEYGNYIGETLKMADELQIHQVTLGVMLGKAVKLAAGQLDTHSRRATMDKDFVQQMLSQAECPVDCSGITLARELWDIIPATLLPRFVSVVIAHCRQHCQPLLPDGELTILLIDENGKVYGLS